ncbi:MAG TPA: TonB-dependent receptor plug domain-containing protein, partial [Sphingomicrobium sp.]
MRTTLAMAAATALCVLKTAPAFAAGAELAAPEGGTQPILASVDLDDLSGLSIEQLADIPVTSASKRAEPLSKAPTAMFVITGEDIEQAGAQSLAGALRLAPNLDVQQIDASQYAIAARGFNGLQAGNKLLALIDGRSIYTPLASSIFWNLHQPMLEDIQQIEVISGPGGTLYGPNAVNGVISITSRDAQDTLGTLVRGTAGTGIQTIAARHGFAIGQSGAMRIYGNWMDREGLASPAAGNAIDDHYEGFQAGFRADFVGASDHVTVQGDLLRTDIDTASGDGAKAHNLLARWSHVLSPSASFQLQAYYDRFK